jgi:hypothetical protein
MPPASFFVSGTKRQVAPFHEAKGATFKLTRAVDYKCIRTYFRGGVVVPRN